MTDGTSSVALLHEFMQFNIMYTVKYKHQYVPISKQYDALYYIKFPFPSNIIFNIFKLNTSFAIHANEYINLKINGPKCFEDVNLSRSTSNLIFEWMLLSLIYNTTLPKVYGRSNAHTVMLRHMFTRKVTEIDMKIALEMKTNSSFAESRGIGHWLKKALRT